MHALSSRDLTRVQALHAELGPGDGVSAERWGTLAHEQAYFAAQLHIHQGPANLTEPFRLIRLHEDQPVMDHAAADEAPLVGPRWWFHLLGLRHGTVHAVLTTPQGWFIVQRRSRLKDDAPGALDIAVSDHIGTESPHVAIWREMAEEVGLTMSPNDEPPSVLGNTLTYRFWYDCEMRHDTNPPVIDRERRWIFSGDLTSAGLGRLQFADGEVTSLQLIGPVELRELADRCRRQQRQAPGELNLASGLIATLPRWLDLRAQAHDPLA